MSSPRSQQRRGSIPLGGDARHGGPGRGTARHGLPLAVIEGMRAAQRNLCAICHRPLGLVPLIDHSHALARLHPHPEKRGCQLCVRGLLCNGCNLMLGYAEDNPEVLDRGAEYLRRWAARH